MTKEITKAIILQEIQDKFKLRDFDPAKFLFDETVVPIYNIEQHVENWKQAESRVSITSAASFLFYTVPENERWTVRSYVVIFVGTPASTIAGIYIKRKESPSLYTYLDLEAGQNVSYLTTLILPAIMNPGDALYINFDGYTSTENVDLLLDYMVEEIR